MGKAEVTPWNRFEKLLGKNNVPIYRVCSELEIEESALREKITKVEITLLEVMKIWKLVGGTSERILNLFYVKRGE